MAAELLGTILEIDIVGGSRLVQHAGPVAPRMIDVGLQRHGILVGQLVLPATEEIPAGYFLMGARHRVKRRRQGIQQGRLAGTTCVIIALHGHAVARIRHQIGAKTNSLLPGIVMTTELSGFDQTGIAREALAINPPVPHFPGLAAIAQFAGRLRFLACADTRHPTLRRGCRLTDDIDHPIDRVGPPQRRPWPANDFDALDVGHHRVLHVPIDPGKGRRIDTAPVHQHQQLVGKTAIEPARTDRPAIGADLRHLQTRCHAQRIGDRFGP